VYGCLEDEGGFEAGHGVEATSVSPSCYDVISINLPNCRRTEYFTSSLFRKVGVGNFRKNAELRNNN
jgi:hypothetical protein